MLSRMPMLARVKKSEVPPEEISGSGMPLVGTRDEHHADVEEGLQQNGRW